MAYYKRKFRNRRFKRRRQVPWYRKKYNAVQVASAALRGVNYLKGLVNSEKFKHDFTGTPNVDWSGTVVSLTSISQNDTDTGRTGNSIFVRSLYIRGQVVINASATSSEFVRIMIFIDKQQVGDTAPTAADVLETTSNINAPNSPLNLQTVGRFTLLRSFQLSVNPEKPSVQWKVNIPMRHHVRYNGTTANDIQRGGLYMLMISDNSSDLPQVRYYGRISYHDN